MPPPSPFSREPLQVLTVHNVLFVQYDRPVVKIGLCLQLLKSLFPRRSKGGVNKKMPKIDTLDVLDDEMTSILNTL